MYSMLQASVWKPLPSLVYGIVSTVSGLLYVFLPETFGQILPDTIEQAERFGRRPCDHKWVPDQSVSTYRPGSLKRLTAAFRRYDSTLIHSGASDCLSVCLSSAVCRLRFGTTVCPIGRTERVLAVGWLNLQDLEFEGLDFGGPNRRGGFWRTVNVIGQIRMRPNYNCKTFRSVHVTQTAIIVKHKWTRKWFSHETCAMYQM